jgi:glucuronate isomerase
MACYACIGVNENLITGNASDEEKFLAWAKCFPQTIRNPLFHWSQMELKNPFGIDEYLNESTAPAIYKYCNGLLQNDAFSTKGLLKHFNVEMVGTTDDPCDDLSHHKKIKADGFETKVLPSFRPDKLLNIRDKLSFMRYIEKLETVSSIKIKSFADYLEAVENRVSYFHENGCRIADHGLSQMPSTFSFSLSLEKEFSLFIER